MIISRDILRLFEIVKANASRKVVFVDTLWHGDEVGRRVRLAPDQAHPLIDVGSYPK